MVKIGLLAVKLAKNMNHEGATARKVGNPSPLCTTFYVPINSLTSFSASGARGSGGRLTPVDSSSSRGPHEPKVVLFPLTLALSLGERETLSTLCEPRSDPSFISPRPMVLPLPEGEGGVRGNAANSNPRRTRIPGIITLRESPGGAGGFPI